MGGVVKKIIIVFQILLLNQLAIAQKTLIYFKFQETHPLENFLESLIKRVKIKF